MSRYLQYFSRSALLRRPSPIRAIEEAVAKMPPSRIEFSAGQPNPTLFPFESAVFTLKDGTTLSIGGNEMKYSLGYGMTQGYPPLVQWLFEWERRLHDPPSLRPSHTDPDSRLHLCLTTGSQDGCTKLFDLLLDEGDYLITEKETYPAMLAYLRPMRVGLIGVAHDGFGMQPDQLRAELERRWGDPEAVRRLRAARAAGSAPREPLPKVIYTVPIGHNPAGSVQTLERKRAIYQVAHDYDLIIIEDDPYFFLQFDTQHRVPSYLSMDTDCRVVRCDSFSKLMAAGLRVGFISGPFLIIQRLIFFHAANLVLSPPLPQVMIYEFLKKVGPEGFIEHANKVAKFYESQKNMMVEAVKRHLAGLADWTEPQAGMFLWVRLLGVSDSWPVVQQAMKENVAAVPGSLFAVETSDPPAPSPYLRLCFSLVGPEKVERGLAALARIIREHQTAAAAAATAAHKLEK